MAFAHSRAPNQRAAAFMSATVTLEPEHDPARRRYLALTTAAVGVVGLGFASIPFIDSWKPSERARAVGGPTTVDLTPVEPGQMIVVSWRRQPIYIVHRTPGMLARLAEDVSHLKDPRSSDSEQPPYASNLVRARRPEYWIGIGICTHLGCLPKPRFEPGQAELGSNWPGGFFCPCHGSRFDLAGRVFEGSPASVNLRIPGYAFEGSSTLVIGADEADG